MNLLNSTFSECLTFFQLTSLLSQSSCISFLNFMRVSIASIRYAQFIISTVFVCVDYWVMSFFNVSATFFLLYSSSSIAFSFCLADSSSAISISTYFIAQFSRARCQISSLLQTGLKGSLCDSKTGLRLVDVLTGVGVAGILCQEMPKILGDSFADSVFSLKLVDEWFLFFISSEILYSSFLYFSKQEVFLCALLRERLFVYIYNFNHTIQNHPYAILISYYLPLDRFIITMIYISDKQQERIRNKIVQLPQWLKKEYLAVFLFELLGTLIIAYGTCMGRYTHPISDRVINITFQFLNCCFYYFAMSVSAPFSGGHLNPAISISLHFFKKNKFLKKELLAQFIGAMIGATVAYLFFKVVPFFYWENVDFGSLVLDTIGEAFGTFVFVFFICIITETNYMAGQYFRYLLISLMLLGGKAFTLRKACLNPIIGITFQFYAAIEKGNFLLFLPYSLTLIIGPIVGGICAVYFFKDFYGPLKEGLATQRDKESNKDQEQP